jgi:hypothetical protein
MNMQTFMNEPLKISLPEWQEIMQLQYVRDGWGLEDETAEEFASMVYGVKFDFVSGSPGYIGDLYILQGDVLTGDPPVMLVRRSGTLELAYDSSDDPDLEN